MVCVWRAHLQGNYFASSLTISNVGVLFWRWIPESHPKEEGNILVVWFHIVKLLFWLFLLCWHSRCRRCWNFLNSLILNLGHIAWFSFSWQVFFRQRFSVFRIKQCTRKQPWNWDATFLLIRLQRCSGSKTGGLSKWHQSLWESRTLAKAESFVQVSIRWIIMLASCWYVHLHMLIKLVFTCVKLLTGKGQVVPRLSWMFWVRTISRKVEWIFALDRFRFY